MEARQTRGATVQAPTQALAAFAATLRYEDLPAPALAVAKHCILDWLGVTLAGSHDPLVAMLVEEVADQGGHEQASVIGWGQRASMSQAALVNGAAGHALDFDDVLRAFMGHPTAPVLPALLALAERRGASGRDLIEAFAAGVELEARVGRMMTESHYARGFHSTATLGTIGAATACGRLLGFDADRMATAIGIAATQAAGLKSMFGTMCKPLHAGKAAQNGLLAASLAARGFTSRQDALECVQGIGETQSDGLNAEAGLAGLGSTWHLPDVLFKYHPACYGTHAPIEASRKVAANDAYDPSAVEQVEVRVDQRCLRMCNIPEPVTGLEGKFSLRYNVGLALAGRATGALGSYEDAATQAPPVVALRDKVRVEPADGLGANEAEVVVHLRGGLVLREREDVGVPKRDLDDQWSRLVTKFRALTEPLVGTEKAAAIVAAVTGLERAEGVSGLLSPLTRIEE
ncbi:MAG: MmgE/PrpD family protein [Alphaproteobacteria bacterium]